MVKESQSLAPVILFPAPWKHLYSWAPQIEDRQRTNIKLRGTEWYIL